VLVEGAFHSRSPRRPRHAAATHRGEALRAGGVHPACRQSQGETPCSVGGEALALSWRLAMGPQSQRVLPALGGLTGLHQAGAKATTFLVFSAVSTRIWPKVGLAGPPSPASIEFPSSAV